MSDTGPIAVVTGASRGAGVGIAHALGSHGCTVYVTGRTEAAGESPLPGTIHETAELVTAAGGKGIAVRVDHGDDDQVKALFDQVQREQGKIDILVNNAALIRDEMMGRTKFWEEPVNVIDTLDVGLREQLRRHRLRRAADGCAAQGPGGFHVVLRCGPLCVRPGIWGTEGGYRQDGRGHGGGLQRVWHRGGLDLDGFVADAARQEHHCQQPREVRSHTGYRRDSRAHRPCHLGALQRPRSHGSSAARR